MDGTRFDVIAKGFVAAASRRRLLGGLGGALLAALQGGPTATGAAKGSRRSYVASSDATQTIRDCTTRCEETPIYAARPTLRRCIRACVRGRELCNRNVCDRRQFCCNWSCSICASKNGGVCTQQFCCQDDSDCDAPLSCISKTGACVEPPEPPAA